MQVNKREDVKWWGTKDGNTDKRKGIRQADCVLQEGQSISRRNVNQVRCAKWAAQQYRVWRCRSPVESCGGARGEQSARTMCDGKLGFREPCLGGIWDDLTQRAGGSQPGH